ncbi:MAG: hypothetical protein HKN85_07675 [Gammaproteobacteria bacterium]|nr:hypothetical protein [Gammaproteobacteria bacterium]
MQLVDMQITASLVVPESVDLERARKLLEKAEQTCLVTNSLTLESKLETSVVVG